MAISMDMPVVASCPFYGLEHSAGRKDVPAFLSQIARPFGQKRKGSFSIDEPSKSSRLLDPASEDGASRGVSEQKLATLSFDEAVERSACIFDGICTEYLKEYHVAGEYKARAVAEQQVPAKYEELCDIVSAIVPATSSARLPRSECAAKKDGSAGQQYDAIEFRGRPLLRAASRSCNEEWEKLAHARSGSNVCRARDALVAALAAISSRSENAWLDFGDTQGEWKRRQQGRPSTEHAKIFEEVLAEALAQGARGYFANALLNPRSTFRVAFVADDAQPKLAKPASLLITYTVPLCKAFQLMDDNGPLRGQPSDWQRWSQYALQDLRVVPEGKKGSKYERAPVQELCPEPRLRELLNSGEDVIMLDAFAALAPRKEARALGLGDIVKAELAALLRDAKERGQAVVFMLGGDDEQTLAHKVYLKAPFTDYGLRCGYLRWKESASDASWAREKSGDDRLCVGIQLP